MSWLNSGPSYPTWGSLARADDLLNLKIEGAAGPLFQACLR
jgi:hypothetical protein